MAIDPWTMLVDAQKRVPALRYAMGLVGLAAAASVAITLGGSGRNTVLVVGVVLCGMVVFFVATRAMQASVKATRLVAAFLMWAIVLAFVAFVIFTVSSFVSGWPCKWGEFIGVSECSKPLASCAKLIKRNEAGFAHEEICDKNLDRKAIALENLRALQFYLTGVAGPQVGWLLPSVARYADSPTAENRDRLHKDIGRVSEAIAITKEAIVAYYQATGDHETLVDISHLLGSRDDLLAELEHKLVDAVKEQKPAELSDGAKQFEPELLLKYVDDPVDYAGAPPDVKESGDLYEWGERYKDVLYRLMWKIEQIQNHINTRS